MSITPANKPKSQREVRKRLLQLEAESYRLDIAANLQQLRKPISYFQHVPTLLGLLSGKANVLGTALAIIAGKRLGWMVKAIPLALAGWRIAKLLQNMRARQRKISSSH